LDRNHAGAADLVERLECRWSQPSGT
jgi:hypothetical protein